MNSKREIKLLNKTKNIRNNQIKYMKGTEILQRVAWRISHEDLIISISRKFLQLYINRFLLFIFSIRKKIKREEITKYFYHWKYLSNNINNKNNKEEIKSKLKLIILRKENDGIKILAKYFNIWKFKKQNKELHNNFCNIFESFYNKNMINNKKDLINNLCESYINIQGKKFSQLKLRKLFEKLFYNKIMNILRGLVIKFKIKKLVEITKEVKKNDINYLIIKIIRRWRFASFVSNLTKKKLELIYNNLHVSYLDIANEVFNTENNITLKEFKSLYELNSGNKIKIENNSFFIKELGFNSETKPNRFFEKI